MATYSWSMSVRLVHRWWYRHSVNIRWTLANIGGGPTHLSAFVEHSLNIGGGANHISAFGEHCHSFGALQCTWCTWQSAM